MRCSVPQRGSGSRCASRRTRARSARRCSRPTARRGPLGTRWTARPDGRFHGLEGRKHMATAIVPGIYDPALPTRTEFVTTEDAEDAVRRLAQQTGVFVGWSSGAAIVAAERVLSAHPPATDRESFRVRPSDPVVVVIAPDSGTRYLSERRP